MVPIHESDIAEGRWAQAEWNRYELWEKIEVKLRRRRSFWILGAVVLFLVLSSIPILIDHWPKWTALRASSVLGEQINELKHLAGSENHAFRLEFSPDHKLNYTVSKVANCNEPMIPGSGTVVRTGSLLSPTSTEEYALVSPEQGRQFGVPGLVESFCYDSLQGSVTTQQPQSLAGFGIIPVKDLTTQRQDRMSLLIFKGPSAEVSFE